MPAEVPEQNSHFDVGLLITARKIAGKRLINIYGTYNRD